MSIRVPKSQLTPAQKQQYLNELHIAPSNYFAQQHGAEPESWDFLEITPTHYNLPFNYALDQGYGNPDQPTTQFQMSPDFKLREYQKPLCRQVFQFLSQAGCGTKHMGTGAGKTLTSVYEACRLKLFTLVVHPFVVLQQQWVDAFRKNSNAKVWEPGSKTPIEEAQVVVCSKWSYSKVPEEFLNKVGLLIVDEVHRFYTRDSVGSLLCTQPNFVIACSATPFKKDKDLMLNRLVGEEIVRYQVEKKYKILRIDTQIKIPLVTRQSGPGGTRRPDWTGIENEIANNSARTELIVKIVRQTVASGLKMFVITKRSEHRKQIVERLTALGVSVDYLSDRKHKYNEADVLVANFGKAATGLDEATNCLNFSGKQTRVLLIASSIKDPEAVAQMVGRVRHSAPIIMDLVDQNRILLNHWKARLKVYNDLHHWLQDPNLKVKVVELTAEEILEEEEEEEPDPWAQFE